MARRLYVGNIPYTVTEAELAEHFRQFGTVTSSRVVTDRETQQSRGFGFVEMATDEEAAAAIASGGSLSGRALVVNEAQPKPDFRGGGSGGGKRDSDGRDHQRDSRGAGGRGDRREPRW